MKSYAKCPDEVAARAASLIKKFHPDLDAVGIRIDFISVSTDEEGGTALAHNGYPAAAIVKIVGPKERAIGRGDAEIVIDEEGYTDMSDAQKDALIDHELYHLEIVRNKHGRHVLDCNRRPKLKMRLHDRQYGWFDEIAQRHGSASIECQQATRLFLGGKQTYFEFALKSKELGEGVRATVSMVG